MSESGYDYVSLLRRPAWDEGGGILYVSQTVPKDGSPTSLYRHKPSIGSICGPLMGTPIRKEGKIVGVHYPAFHDRMRLYREGVELIRVFRDYADLFTLALYRRQVTEEEDISIDVLFFSLAKEARLSCSQWAMLAQRMPERSGIHEACERYARIEERSYAAA